MSAKKHFAIRRDPDHNGHFGEYGGRYVSENLMPVLQAIENEYRQAVKDEQFQRELQQLLRDYVGRPSPLYYAERLTQAWGGARVFLKREDLNHTGAHKINNTIGQALLARRMGKKRLMAETGAGQHGVATATAAALFGMACDVYMGAEDIRRQAPNVRRMEFLGACVHSVSSGTATLKDAMSEALRVWVACEGDTFYVIGTVAGPHPYPMLVQHFQSVIGREARAQILQQAGCLPNLVVACVGGGSNAAGIFDAFLNDQSVSLLGAEAAGQGLATGRHAASINAGRVGILHGSKSYLLQDGDGQIRNAYSVSAGLDYPGIGPAHAAWADCGRVKYVGITDRQALKAFYELTRLEGILPALESSHALAAARMRARRLGSRGVVVVCLSGRGDKDLEHVAAIAKPPVKKGA
jgi:tryptophan synthase beta chain